MKEEVSKTSGMSISTIILLVLFLIVCAGVAVVYNFYDEIMNRLKNYFHDDTREKELENELQLANDNAKNMEGELGSLKQKLSSKTSKKSAEKKEEKKEKKSYDKLSKKEKKLYSPDQFVKEQGYCYVGEENNMRHCVEVYNGDVCESGDIYKRIDKCLMPKSFA